MNLGRRIEKYSSPNLNFEICRRNKQLSIREVVVLVFQLLILCVGNRLDAILGRISAAYFLSDDGIGVSETSALLYSTHYYYY